MPDPQCNSCEHKEATCLTPHAIPVGFSQVTPTNIDDGDAASSPHHMEPQRGE